MWRTTEQAATIRMKSVKNGEGQEMRLERQEGLHGKVSPAFPIKEYRLYPEGSD